MHARAAALDRVVDVEPVLRRALVASYGPEIGADAASEAIAWACAHIRRLDDIENLGGYLYRVGQTAVRRAVHHSHVPIGGWDIPVHDPVAIEPGLTGALEDLAPRQREVVLLVKAWSYPVADVARILDCSESTVRVHLDRGLARLRAALKVMIDD